MSTRLEAAGIASLLRRPAGREDLFLGLFLLCAVNGFGADVGAYLAPAASGVAGGALFGMDAVALASAVVGVILLVRGRGGASEIGAADWWGAGLVTALVLLPHQAAGWLGVSVLAPYAIITARRNAPLAAGAAVFFAVAVHEAWGRLLLAAVTPVWAPFDAALAAGLLGLFRDGVARSGNVIDTGVGYEVVVVSACIAVKPMLQGLLAFLAFTRAVRPRWRWTELWCLVTVAGGVVAINAVRLAATSWSLEHHLLLHDGLGQSLVGLAVLAFAFAVAAIGTRDELLNRHSRR